MKKTLMPFCFFVLLIVGFIPYQLQSQSEHQKNEVIDFVSKVKMSEEQLIFEFTEDYQSFTVELVGPEETRWTKTVREINQFVLSSKVLDGMPLVDGRYKLEITPNFELSKAEQKVLRYLTETDQMRRLKAEKELLGIPYKVDSYTRNFSIKDNKLVLPKYESYGLKLPTDNTDFGKQSVPTIDWAKRGKERPIFTNNLQLLNDPIPQFVAQVISTDLIVQGSSCVGIDCVNGESFGFDTQRLKENNLRIKFQDTSVSASFPTNDWQITANDSSNGGANKFSIDDIDGGRTPFTIEAGTPSHTLYVDNGGRIGIGTSTPVVEIHNKDGDTPTLRLEQDGSSGFGAQTWDVAGNETNFFIRDATNGSKLPFRIRPGAPESSIDIANDGDIGMGTSSPQNSIHISRNNATSGIRLQQTGNTPGIWDINLETTGLKIIDNSSGGEVVMGFNSSNNNQLQLPQYANNAFLNAVPAAVLSVDASGNVFTSAYGGGGGSADVDWLKTDNSPAGTINDEIYTLGKVAIGGTTLEQELHVTGNVAISGSILPVSDKRLKEKINTLELGLSTIQQLRPTSYHFRTKEYSSMNLLEGKQYGFIAQELEKVLPNLVTDSSNSDKSKAFKRVNYTGLIPFLVSGMQEQQTIIETQQSEIETLKAKLSEMDELKTQVANLAKLIQTEKAEKASVDNAAEQK